MILTKKQTTAIDYLQDNTTEILVFGGGSGGGKSLLGVYWITKMAMKYPGTRYIIGRNSLKTLRETTFQTHIEMMSMQGMVAGAHYEIKSHDFQIHYRNGSTVIYKDLGWTPSDPNYDRLGSLELTAAFIDEGSEIHEKAMNVVRSRIRYKLTEYNLSATLLVTCNPTRGWIYDIYSADKSGTLSFETKFVQSLLTDNPHLPESYGELLAKLDKPSVQRLLYGNWDYQDNKGLLMDFDSINDVFTNDYIHDNEHDKWLTCDIALQGADKFVLMVWHGMIVVEIMSFDKTTYKEVEAIIKDLANDHSIQRSHIIYDSDGVGDFLGDYLRGATAFHNGAPPVKLSRKSPQNFENLKSQCYWKLAEAVNEGTIYIRCKSEHRLRIIEELSVCRNRNWGRDGKLSILRKLEFKHELGYSPDFADCIMQRFLPELKDKGGFALGGAVSNTTPFHA